MAASVHIPPTPLIPSTLSNHSSFTGQQQLNKLATTSISPPPSFSPPPPSSLPPFNHTTTATKSHLNDDLAGVIHPDTPLQQWSVDEVFHFVSTLPGCSLYAQEFQQQEIDGSALCLLKEDHLMTTLNVKLGPALKICAVVNSFKTPR